MANNLDEAHPDLTEENLKQLLNTSSVPLTDKIPLENLSTLFKAPDNPQFTYGSFGETFERYKVRVDLLKWLIGTVGLTLITFIINWGFRDREQGMNEISQYDKYASELIVLNDNPVNKRMLAQFFANVTPSEKLKDGWKNYYKEVNLEYKIFLEVTKTDKQRLDSLRKIDSTSMTPKQKLILKEAENKVIENDNKINAPLFVPELTSNLEGNIKAIISNRFAKSNNKNIGLAKEFEDKGFSFLVNMDIDNAIKSFTQSENSFNRYNMVYDIATYLKNSRDNLLNNNPTNWKPIYATILSEYSWKMPEKYKSILTELSK